MFECSLIVLCMVLVMAKVVMIRKKRLVDDDDVSDKGKGGRLEE